MMSKPQLDITLLTTRSALHRVLRTAINSHPLKDQIQFNRATWTCQTFDEWISLAENWFDIVGVRNVAKGENNCTTEDH
jgi:hypothetical protein